MADREQITGAILDGPLACDNAVSDEAASIKGIRSQVAADADIFLVPERFRVVFALLSPGWR